MNPKIRSTRFAPSPTGYLHVGNAYSALRCQQWAEQHGARLLLRIEDIDTTRCRAHYVDAILEDLQWLGIRWSAPPRFQLEHARHFQDALAQLREMGVIYPCFCTRSEIEREIRRMASAPHASPSSGYPGTCRHLSHAERTRRLRSEPHAWRLHCDRIRELVPADLCWRDAHGLRHPARLDHDLVIGRKDIGFSYHLAVVVDDAEDQITDVIRGEDLRPSTGLHRILQYLLKLPDPVYHHHRLIRDANGKRLAKRNRSAELRQLRQAGIDPQRLRRFLLEECEGVWPFATIEQARRHLASASACPRVPGHDETG